MQPARGSSGCTLISGAVSDAGGLGLGLRLRQLEFLMAGFEAEMGPPKPL
jgi:hypothetical protein